MLRSIPVLLAVVALASCSRKDEPVVAAPVTGSAPAGSAPAPAQDGALPPNHPPLDGAPGTPGGDPMGGGAPEAPPHGAAMSAGPDEGDVKVEKASGKDARTVAEVFAERASLKGKSVTVRGKVVKYNPGIMGKNWLHLRDGTGTAGKDNDVTVTTQDTAKKGEVVTVKGTVAVDQDIGMGGAPYPVIIEDAKVSR
ncbi:MAG TPA: OB-fold nucleic acid binding domain-containing protein [Anaeromyxobacter sp.]|nr:OB-fold nucleic acid binding domain-containing protein [Anaeromyxobacter sp.]